MESRRAKKKVKTSVIEKTPTGQRPRWKRRRPFSVVLRNCVARSDKKNLRLNGFRIYLIAQFLSLLNPA